MIKLKNQRIIMGILWHKAQPINEMEMVTSEMAKR